MATITQFKIPNPIQSLNGSNVSINIIWIDDTGKEYSRTYTFPGKANATDAQIKAALKDKLLEFQAELVVLEKINGYVRPNPYNISVLG